LGAVDEEVPHIVQERRDKDLSTDAVEAELPTRQTESHEGSLDNLAAVARSYLPPAMGVTVTADVRGLSESSQIIVDRTG
jgi:hypothetical protein